MSVTKRTSDDRGRRPPGNGPSPDDPTTRLGPRRVPTRANGKRRRRAAGRPAAPDRHGAAVPAASEIAQVATERLGFSGLRDGQAQAVAAVLAGRDTLAILPTGGGKSAIYQIAAYLLSGPTVVVSPLLALQRDQVEAIGHHDLGRAAELNSTLSETEHRRVLDDLVAGSLEFVFLAPEQLANDHVLACVRAARPSLFVIDEAHCISEWGHDFRPDYLHLGTVLDSLGRPKTLAMTATAAPPVRAEIVQRLGLRDPSLVLGGFDRPNIWLGVTSFVEGRDAPGAKTEALVERVAQTTGSGLVYAATRRRAEAVAADLQARGIEAAAYHAGMRASEREGVQTRFMSGGVRVVVATTAFGMGIDKPGVRFVFHHDISESVDSLYQELGRAGRDGEPAESVLFYDPADLNLPRFFNGGAGLDLDEVEEVAEVLAEHRGPTDATWLRQETDLTATRLGRILDRLEETGAVQVGAGGEVALTHAGEDREAMATAAMEADSEHRQFARSRVEMVRGYAETQGCRRAYLLTYFGEERSGPCGHCDNCEAGLVANATAEDEQRPFAVGSHVDHRSWGTGQVLRYDGDKIVVLFDSVGYRNLSLEVVQEGDLLHPADAVRARPA